MQCRASKLSAAAKNAIAHYHFVYADRQRVVDRVRLDDVQQPEEQRDADAYDSSATSRRARCLNLARNSRKALQKRQENGAAFVR